MNPLDALSQLHDQPPFADVLAAIGLTVTPLAAHIRSITSSSRPTAASQQRPNINAASAPAREIGLRAKVDEQCRADPDRLPWPDEWWSGADSEDARRCRELWAEVLRFCLGELCREVITWAPRGNTSALLSWVRGGDCAMVAALAGVDVDALRDRVLPMLATVEGATELQERLFPMGPKKAASR